MTTPPLDLPALRKTAKAATPGPWVSIPGSWGGDGYIDRAAQINGELEIAVCDYGADRDHIAAFDPPTVLALLDRVEELGRDLAAVTVSRDGWQTRAEAAEAESKVLRSAVETSNDAWAALTTRAEAAEKKVAAVREVHKPFEAEEYYNGMDGESLSRVVYECAGCADVGGIRRYPCPTITALDTHTPETETP